MNTSKTDIDYLKVLSNNTDFIEHVYFKNANIMIILDENGHIKSVNDSFFEKINYDEDEIIDKNINSIFKEIDVSVLKDQLVLSADKIFRTEIYINDREGKLLFFNVHIILLKDNSDLPAGFLVSAEDKTEYKLLNEKLNERTLRLESIFKAFPDKLFLITREGIIKDYYIGDIGNLYVRPEELIGKNFQTVLPSPASMSLLEAIEKVKRTAQMVTYEYSLIIHDEERYYEGRLVPLDNGDILNIIRDISKIKKSEKEISLLISTLEVTNSSILITDRDGRIIWSNKAFEKLTGYTFDEIKGKNPSILKSDLNNKEVYENLWKAINAGNSWYGFLFNKRKDGSIYIDEQTITPINDDAGKIAYFVAVKHDKSFHKKLGEHLDIHLGLWYLVKDAVIVTDKDFKITFWNSGAENIYGWKFSEVFGKKLTDILDSEENAEYKEKIFKKLIDEGEVNVESFQKNKSGKEIWIESSVSEIRDSDKKLIGYIGLNRNITDKKKLTEEIVNDRKLLKSIFDSTSEGILVLDKNKKIIMYNNSASNYLHAFSGLFEWENVFDIWSGYGEIGNSWDERIDEVLNGGRVQRFIDNYKINGENKYLNSIFFPVSNGSGNTYMAGIVFNDITTEKIAEANHLETEKLTAIGKVAAYISHEMKTPLNSINMNIDILKNVLNIPPNRMRSFDIIQKEVKRLSHLMKDILQFSHVDTMNYGQASVFQIINNIKILLEPVLNKKNITFINDVVELKINFNPEKLESVFIHLIENSIDAMPGGGKIYIYSERDSENNKLFIYIKDNGIGINEPDKIFQPFYTTKNDGTGLGMPIIKNILSQNGGEIKLISSINGNTLFRVSLNI